MKIDYHKWKDYKECPKKFFLRNIQQAPPTVPVNDYPRLYGRLIQKFFEMYCNVWRYKTPYLFPEHVRERMVILYDQILQTTTVNWSSFICTLSRDEILEKAIKDAVTIIESPSLNLFLNTKSEISIEVQIKGGHVIDGRLDFLHHLPPPDYDKIILFDGKGTNKIGKNIDEDQLKFYTLLCFFQFKKIPDEIGFFYFQLNTYTPVLMTKDILNEFRAKVSLDIKTMTSDIDYAATPSAKACKFCPYAAGCLECLKSKGSRAKKSKIVGLEGDGVIEFGLDA
jgi:CRISPR/Cas system-associated exonuclease Cas4 (RecB family)